ncbi:diguanylate cyclase domain-containing protein [Cupriavidus metallidurans]|uniref:diguanylate cyclase domain-containing protein n=1 Tax=Cupriavidus metallidurans TaxID=119219 RepID=UPI001CCD5015|nr:diguanylate cyclase [Cupriavidus metallidurans]UBM10226.1 diguanylate cyclase [Cupriavidus metallidurans]
MQRAGEGSLPAGEQVSSLIWPFVPVVVALALFCIASVDVLSAARSFVAGESLWTKGQKAAVLHLLNYSRSQLDTDYDAYLAAIAVPLGDRQARIELEKHPRYDHTRAVEGLLIGGNHTDDISGMIRLYRTFRGVAEIDEAIEIWAAADVDIARLDTLSRTLRGRFRAGDCDARCVAPIRREIVDIDNRLTPQEAAFSSTLGRASRRVRALLTWSSIAVAVTLLAWVTWVSRSMMIKERQLRAALSTSEERLQLAVAGSNDGLWDWHPHRGELYFSPRCAEMLGYRANELPHAVETLMALTHPDDVTELGRRLSGHMRKGTPYDIELRLRKKAEGYLWTRARGRMVRSAVGKAVRMAGSLSDISDRKRFEAQLHTEKERAQVTLQAIGEAVITTDVWGRIESLNPVAEAMTGWTEAEAAGCFLPQVCPLTDEVTCDLVTDLVSRALAGTWPSQTVTVLSRRSTGESSARVVVKPSVALIRDKVGQAIGVVVVLHDVSLERAQAAQLAYEASHDPLTGLVNRPEFERRLETAILRARQEGCTHTLMYLDLDRFKAVNDTCGHAAGDELLCQIADLMRQQLRRSDTLARLGGDEFAVLLEHCLPSDGERVAESLRQAIAAFRFICRGHVFSVAVSVGLIRLDERTSNTEDALGAADVACYRAKRAGRNRVEVS